MATQSNLASSQFVDSRELSEILEDGRPITVVDVRTTEEYRAGHIPKAISIPMDEIESRLEDIPSGCDVVLTCLSGDRSSMTHDQICSKVDGLTCLKGGMDAWESAGLPVVRATRSSMALNRQAMIFASVMILLSLTLGTLVSPSWAMKSHREN